MAGNQSAGTELGKQIEDAWEAAQKALQEARQMPGGADRVAALRRAGKLRFEAHRLRQADESND